MQRNIVLACGIFMASLHFADPAVGQTIDPNPLQLSPHHATISVANMDEESRWYQHVLGFREASRTQRRPGRLVCHLLIPGYRLDLLSVAGSARHQQGERGLEQGWLNIVFQTPAIDKVYKYLLDQGIKVTADRTAEHTLEHLTFKDPEGNEVGIAPQ